MAEPDLNKPSIVRVEQRAHMVGKVPRVDHAACREGRDTYQTQRGKAAQDLSAGCQRSSIAGSARLAHHEHEGKQPADP